MTKLIFGSDPEILAIPIQECHEPFIDIKNQQQLRYGPPPENELTTDCYTKLRKTVVDKLLQAQEDLPKGWYFRIYEGYRSIEVQQILFMQEYNKVVARYPNATREYLFHETTRLVSPVENFDGSINIPPHNTGGAVDLEIITENGELIDMGMAIQDWIKVEPDLCLSNYQGLNAETKQNRQLLLNVMSAHDFINYPTEWWHFSYGDRYWAYHKNRRHAIYGPAASIK